MTHGETGEVLISRLPEYMDTGEESGNYRLLASLGHELDETYKDVDAVDRANTVQHADTIPQLEKLGQLVDLKHSPGDSKEKYRAKLLAEYQLNTSEGTIKDVIRSTATLINSDVDNLTYYPLKNSDSVASIGVPSQKVDTSTLTESEIAEIISDLAPAGKEVQTRKRGTLKYITPEEFQNDDYDPYQGYDGLDADGNQLDPNGDSSGTYAGLIN